MPDTLTSPVAGRVSVQACLWATGIFFLALLIIFHDTTWSMISIWLRSDTYAHGFLILPISLWLVWNKRDQLRGIDSRPALWVALLLIPPGLVWLLAWLVDVLVVQQLALVAMLVIGAWATMGHQLARALVFPLLFLFFAVPMGEALVPSMMEFTASSTVWMVQQTGIPVYREGLYFTLPSGSWSVVEACSGVRYVIASVTLGVLYAYLTYRSYWRRGLFVLASAIVPVFANSVRAYIIVMLGHLSDMKLAVGMDHLIYGWVFFGLVMFLLFWLGSIFREDRIELTHTRANGAAAHEFVSPDYTKLFLTVASCLFFASIWPFLIHKTELRPEFPAQVDLAMPDAKSSWRKMSDVPWSWNPNDGSVRLSSAYYQLEGSSLGLYVEYAHSTPMGGEIVGRSSQFAVQDASWREVSRRKVRAVLDEMPVWVDQAELRGVDGTLLVWSWYRVSELDTSNDYIAKFYEALARLGVGRPGTCRVVVAVQLNDSLPSSHLLIQSFLDEHYLLLSNAMNSSWPQPG